MQIMIQYESDSHIHIWPNGTMPSHSQVDMIIKAFLEWKKSHTEQEILENNRREWLLFHGLLKKVEVRTEKKTPKEPGSGFIYLIKQGIHYKIGRTRKPKDRIAKYSTENPYEQEVIFLAIVPNYISVEGELLLMFEEKRYRGEWFALDLEDIDMIKQYIILSAGLFTQID